MTGPLHGIRVLELASIGPGPHACMILADLGAEVLRVDRPGGSPLSSNGPTNFLNRGRPTLTLDLKQADAVATFKQLAGAADVFIEGMRPSVAERIGIGPADLHAVNPRLIYGRMTGWGQDGPLAHTAGHDMNYISIAGALHNLGQDPARPHFPANLLGDFGGGSTYLVIGVLAALLEARVSGHGQVVDAAIVDGTAHLNAMSSAMLASGQHQPTRAANMLEGGLPYYDIYPTKDGRHLSVGALEGKFFTELMHLLELPDAPGQADFAEYDELRTLIAGRIAAKTLAEWEEIFAGTDACVAPILTLTEAAGHPHLVARGTFVQHNGHVQPAPAPRFSRTPTTLGTPAGAEIEVAEALARWV